MSPIRHCLAMTLGVVALAFGLVVLGIPGAVVLALAPVAVCLAMVLFMSREGDVDAGLRRYWASLDGNPTTGHNTPREYPPTVHEIGR